MKTIHVIVATGEWGQDQLRYRRHRLAEYLNRQADTEEIIWLCPSNKPQNGSIPTSLSNGIKQWDIAELGTYRFLRFARFLPIFYKTKLEGLQGYLQQKQGHFRMQLWYTYPAFSAITEIVNWDRIVYDCSDLWAESLDGSASVISLLKQRIVYRGEQKVIQAADYITCTSTFLYERVIQRVDVSKTEYVYVLENGVDYQLFQQQKQASIAFSSYDLVLGFIGGIKPKLDFELLFEIVKQKPHWLLLLVGPDSTKENPMFKQLIREPNVIWTGSVLPEEVSGYMNIVDIGIMPYKHSIYNKAIFPLKLFEFLAAGKPALGINLPSTLGYIEKGVYELLEGDINAPRFINACEQLVPSKEAQDLIIRRKQVAKQKDWEIIFDKMISL